MGQYRVELGDLQGFVERLQVFEKRAEQIADNVDTLITELGGQWLGAASDTNRIEHDQLAAVTAEMHAAVTQLRRAANTAYCNYGEVVAVNIAMWP
ncbi:MAG: WXG100 family type VII secretion target [Mycobacteriaceae bacterium]|nr:WXG100 family type VII secretion target [Mycobacteriaceae bacterium]